MPTAHICDCVRTPFGRYGGALARVRADDLAAIPLRALVERNPGVDWACVDDVVFGCANQAGEDNRNVARMALLLAGFPKEVPGTTVNRLCGSSMDAFAIACRSILCGDADLAIAGGVESMSRAPLVMAKSDEPFGRTQRIEDTTMGWRFINTRMKEAYGADTMPETAENVAEQYQVSREAQDAFALRSQQRAAQAIAAGEFDDELIAAAAVTADEHPRPNTTLDGLSKLKPVVRAGGTVTAGNASGLNDGACAILLASEDAVRKYGLKPRACFVSAAVAGVEPRLMGMGPVPATHRALDRAGLTLDQIDLIELNEAFAAQAVAVLRELRIAEDAAHVNPMGGAIALGHPLGASGARLVTTAVHQLQRSGSKYALCTMCIGVGQGIATIVKRI
jgi:acetyl-CoA acyltransferase